MVDLGDNKNRKEGMKIVFIRPRKAVLLDSQQGHSPKSIR
jgi:hypothetical protein